MAFNFCRAVWCISPKYYADDQYFNTHCTNAQRDGGDDKGRGRKSLGFCCSLGLHTAHVHDYVH